MMKTLWTVTSTVGTATVLAIFAMCIWGWMTGHLNAQRIDQLRSIVMATPGDLVAQCDSHSTAGGVFNACVTNANLDAVHVLAFGELCRRCVSWRKLSGNHYAAVDHLIGV